MQAVRCTCGVMCPNEFSLQQHLLSPKHRANVAELQNKENNGLGIGMGPRPALPLPAKAAGRAGKGSGEKGPCRYYANGNCRKGSNCKFSHEIGGGSMKGTSSNKNRQLAKQDVKSEEVERGNRQCSTCSKTSARLTQLKSQTESGQESLIKIASALGELQTQVASALAELQAQVELANANLEQTKLDVNIAIEECSNGDVMPSDQPSSSSVKKNKAVRENEPQSRASHKSETAGIGGSSTKKRTYDERASPISSDNVTEEEEKGLDHAMSSSSTNTALGDLNSNDVAEGALSNAAKPAWTKGGHQSSNTVHSSKDTARTYAGALSVSVGVQRHEEKGNQCDESWECSVCTCRNPKLFLMCSACGSAGGDAAAGEMLKDSTQAEETKPQEDNAKKQHKKDKQNKAAERAEKEKEWKARREEEEKSAAEAAVYADAEKERWLEATKAKEKDAKRRCEKKAEEARLADLARQQEEERTDAEANKQRQTAAKLIFSAVERDLRFQQQEKSNRSTENDLEYAHAVAELGDDTQNLQAIVDATGGPTVSTSTLKAEGSGAAGSGSVISAPMKAKESPSMSRQLTTTSTARRKKTIDVDRLSFYIKPRRKRSKNISPIFDLIQDQRTVEDGRKLMSLEVETRRCKDELAEVLGKKTRLENGIKAEKQLITTNRKQIEELERKTRSKWNIFGLSKMDNKAIDKTLVEMDDDEEEAEGDAELDEDETTITEETTNEVIEDAHAASENAAVADWKVPDTLEELIESCSEFLSGPPSDYIAWLETVEIKTITDLGIAMISDEAMLIAGNGDVGITELKKFAALVFAAVSKENPSTTGATADSTAESQEDKDMADKKARAKQRNKEKAEKKEKRRKGEHSRYRDVKEAKKQIESLKTEIEGAKSSIEKQKNELIVVTPPIVSKMKQLQQLRADIVEIKGDGMEEDTSFHIDNTRDDRGFTILMNSAQSDDFLTAKTCFDLGADAYATSHEGLTAIDYSYFFGFERMTELIVQNGGSLPQKQCGAWSSLQSMAPQSKESSKNWDDTLTVAETAAIPAEQYMEIPEQCEEDEKKRMPFISPKEPPSNFTCFESRLMDPNISDQVQRVVLLNRAVYSWSLSVDPTTRSNFVNVLEGLKPASVRRSGVVDTKIHRRAIVGAATTYEILAARFEESPKGEKVVLFTPFVSGEVEGVSSVGVLVWSVVPDSEASLYKTLVANTEFMRHKVTLDDRFLAHKGSVLELGKDMHLLDLHSTSIWTTSTMELYILNLDDGDLDRIHDPGFTARKRIVYSEEQVNKALFHTVQEEARENEGILASERLDMSSLISGGAGTGKTQLIIKKVSREERSRRVLVVSRLPRLVNMIKSSVETKRGGDTDLMSFTTYDDLLQLLARRVDPVDDTQYKSFVQFDRVHFDCDDSGVSFTREFIDGHLEPKERKLMANNNIESLTLWNAITVIKSQSKCASTKVHLTLEDYTSLSLSYGLTEDQRQLCYRLFLVYENWRESKHYWDEMDRALYVLRFGPSVFREEKFIPWPVRVNKFGEMDLLNEEMTEPRYPFFYDIVCADEAQDFTEVTLVLFARMSASIRSLFLSADPAQSVELGVNMHAGTVNHVFHSLIEGKKLQVKDVLQYVDLQTNHRTHAQNLAIGRAIREMLARSFKIPITNETALINGKLPKILTISKVSDLANASVFRGGNIVFLAPDEKVHELRLQFSQLEINNDLFGVREAKGLEFDACALIGFFNFMDERGSSKEWQNMFRWLSTSSGLVTTEEYDYRLSAPNVSHEAMMLYTALTRARNQLYLIEVDSGKSRKQKGPSLVEYASRTFIGRELAKSVTFIDEGRVGMTDAQHKARGVLYVTQALTMSRDGKPIGSVKDKLIEAKKRFGPDKGNDKDLLDKCEKHLSAVLQKHNLKQFAKEKFLVKGSYNLEGRFAEVLLFEQKAGKFFSEFLCDSFLVEDVHDARCLVEEVFEGTPYEDHFKDVCATIRRLEQTV